MVYVLESQQYLPLFPKIIAVVTTKCAICAKIVCIPLSRFVLQLEKVSNTYRDSFSSFETPFYCSKPFFTLDGTTTRVPLLNPLTQRLELEGVDNVAAHIV